MHRCLHILEIVHLICEEVDLIPKHKRTLAALAGTCRFFEGPALSTLWATLPCIAPLVKSLPPDILSTYLSGTMVIDNPIIPSECSRFFVNARRVKTLDVGIEHSDLHGGPCVHPSVYGILAVFSMGRCLVPNIRTLRWFPRDNPGLISHIPLFLGPKLKAIHFEIGLAETLPLTLLAGLNTRYPSLECLEVTASCDSTSKFAWDLSTVICGLGNLRDLRVPSLEYAASVHIANLPGLVSLRLDDQEVFAIPQAVTFPDLRALSLGCCTPGLLKDVLMAISSRSLEVLNIEAVRSKRSDLEESFEYAKRHCDLSTLRIITHLNTMVDGIGIEGIRTVLRSLDVDEYIIKPNVLRPLLCFPNLTEVDLDPVGAFDLDDAIVKGMAMAWPHLRHLSLGTRYASLVHPRVTLFGLLPIAEHCRSIEFLSIAVDASSGITGSVFPQTRGICNKRLAILGVRNSTIEEPMRVASFLSMRTKNLS